MENNTYNWKYSSVGGVVRVNIACGEDVAHLGELDQKLWTVLSCPVKGLEMDPATLAVLDADHDGKIRAAEVVAAARWITSLIKDKDLIIKGEDTLDIDQINTETEEGQKLLASAEQILRNIGKEGRSITVADATNGPAIFKGTKFNGDGVITALSTEDENLKAVIASISAKIGSTMDRSAEAGVTAEQIEAFYAACADYAAWQSACTGDVLPYGPSTADAYQACMAINDKVADYFMRCKLVNFDDKVAAAVDVSAERIGAISNKNLATSVDVISECPLARPDKSCVLPLGAVNPAWQAAVDKVKALVAPEKDSLTEAEWNGIIAGFGSYLAWMGARKGEAVESLGLEAVQAVLEQDRKADLLALVEQDKALESESNSIDAVGKLLLLYRDFVRFLNNYVIFADFYGRRNGTRGIFEVGQLYLDQRCCDLCIKVEDMGKHADMAAQSGMFLIYCKCESKVRNESMDIVAVMTDGNTRNLRPGKNGIFYDLKGNDWDATITKVVDNPISVKQAFFAPYRKFWEFCVGLINKSASEKDANMTAKLQGMAAEKAAAPGEAPKSQAFDIAKFAGIFAAIGMALGYIGSCLTSLVTGLKTTPLWQLCLIVIAIMLVISGPSCFIAWSKLRKRNVGPVLNANGWAVNSEALISILFGKQLTSVARYPSVKLPDPYVKKSHTGLYVILAIVIVALAAAATLYFRGNLNF